MGLPGSGKSTLTEKLSKKIENAGYNCNVLNADKIRTEYYDWDFSYTGRLRQAYRMKKLSNTSIDGYTIIDMVCPLPEFREIINPNIIIWMDTIVAGRFEDTNKMFIPPQDYHFKICDQDAEKWSSKILADLSVNYIEFITMY